MRPFDSKKSFITLKSGDPVKFRGGFTQFENKKGTQTNYKTIASGNSGEVSVKLMMTQPTKAGAFMVGLTVASSALAMALII